MVFSGIQSELTAQTTVFDEEIYWEWNIPQEYGGYGFYWWHRLDGYNIENYGNMPTDDWSSPDNYYTGEFTMRIEVISQPTSNPFLVQFGIWQDLDKGSNHPETVADRKYVSGGNGAVYEGSLGSPSTWWNKEPGDPVDFSRPEDFYRIGLVLWNPDPLCIPMGHDWNPSGCPENAPDFFPLRVRVTITATAGSGGPVIYPPNYGIDYWGERTSKAVSSDDQYSYDNFSGGTVYDGDNTYLYLTPGTDVYFRKKADWSKKQSLDVPYRPSAPGFTIDYDNEATTETVGSEFEYSSQSDMSGAITGDGSKVSLTPGNNTYFRKKATSSSFKSPIQNLDVPDREAAPNFGIDYMAERTSTVVDGTIEYSTSSDMSGTTSGSGEYVDVTPGTNLYFRKSATGSVFASSIQELTVTGRPSVPAFAIDFVNEQTATVVSTEFAYSTDGNMNGAVNGSGDYVEVTPGTDLYFRKHATASAFKSDIQHLIVPSSPGPPSIAIDFINERSSSTLSNEFEYSPNADMSGSIQGSDAYLSIEPGDTWYIWKTATDSSFISGVQTLISPLRPDAPVAGIDFLNETTDKAISGDLLYSSNSNFDPASVGTGLAVDVIPGEDLFFKVAATSASYESDMYHLDVPGRPVITSSEADTTLLYPFLINVEFFQQAGDFIEEELSVTNATVKNLWVKVSGPESAVYEAEIYALSKAAIEIDVHADVVGEGNFAATSFALFFNGEISDVGLDIGSLTEFRIYPNPSDGLFHVVAMENQTALVRLDVYSITGNLVLSSEAFGSEHNLDLREMPKGLYMLRLSIDNKPAGTSKLIVK